MKSKTENDFVLTERDKMAFTIMNSLLSGNGLTFGNEDRLIEKSFRITDNFIKQSKMVKPDEY